MADRAELAIRFVLRAGRNEAEVPVLASFLQQALEEARRAWPSVGLIDEEFIDHLATRLQPGEDVVAQLRRLRISDLYLACAVIRGYPGAIVAFEEALMRRVGEFIDKINRAPVFVAEVTQALRVKLFIGSNGQGKLSQYSGRGALSSWVCIIAVRLAYDLARPKGREVYGGGPALGVLAASDDPEMNLLRRRYDQAFRVALEAALASLGARERTLLRLYFIERLTAAQIGKLYCVHETTVLRWLAAAREAVFDRVRADLSHKLGLSKEEFNELLALLQSRLDISVGRLLDSKHAHLAEQVAG